jgi:hypothetical protein
VGEWIQVIHVTTISGGGGGGWNGWRAEIAAIGSRTELFALASPLA